MVVVLGIEDGISKGAVALVLDGLPVVVEDLEESPKHGGGLLLGEAEQLHGVQGLPGPVSFGTHVGWRRGAMVDPTELPVPGSMGKKALNRGK